MSYLSLSLSCLCKLKRGDAAASARFTGGKVDFFFRSFVSSLHKPTSLFSVSFSPIAINSTTTATTAFC